MDRKDQELQALKADVRRLEKVVVMLLQRIGALEKQNRSIKANAYMTGLSVASLDRRTRAPRE